MLTRRTLLFAAPLRQISRMAVAASLYRAQDDGNTDKPQSTFDRLFPQPTGANGYEEIIQAAERLHDVKSEDAYPTGTTLAEKRAYINDRACRDALSLLRQGLAKPITLPRTTIDSATTFPDYALLRALGRLLGLLIYVEFADGRNNEAITAVSDGLQLASIVKGEIAIGALVGRAIDAIVMRPLMRARGTWNLRDCDRIYSLAAYYRTMPDPAIAAQAAEREMTLRNMSEFCDKPEALISAVEAMAESESEDLTPQTLQARQFVKDLRADAGLREQVANDLVAAINARYDGVDALLADPTRRMVVDAPPQQTMESGEIARFLVDRITIDPVVVQRYVETRLNFQLLAIHARVCHYRWQNDHLPGGLGDLGMDARWTTDPFTGKMLEYAVIGENNYQLASAGALIPGENGKDHREPVTLPYVRPKPS